MMLAAALPLAMGLSIAAAAPVQQLEEFESAVFSADGWDARVVTHVEWDHGQPFIDLVGCYADSPDLEFAMDRSGGISRLSINFPGPPEPDGDRPQITLIDDVLWLEYDGKRVDVTHRSASPRTFVNFPYPSKPRDEIITPVFIGGQAFRRRAEEPWLPLTRLFTDLARAKHAYWGFVKLSPYRPADEVAADWRRARYPLKLVGFANAIRWCEVNVQSQAAATLPSKQNAGAAPK